MQVAHNKPSVPSQELLLLSYVWNIYGMPSVGHTSAYMCSQLTFALHTAEQEHARCAAQRSCGWDGPLSCAMGAAQLLGGA